MSPAPGIDSKQQASFRVMRVVPTFGEASDFSEELEVQALVFVKIMFILYNS